MFPDKFNLLKRKGGIIVYNFFPHGFYGRGKSTAEKFFQKMSELKFGFSSVNEFYLTDNRYFKFLLLFVI